MTIRSQSRCCLYTIESNSTKVDFSCGDANTGCTLYTCNASCGTESWFTWFTAYMYPILCIPCCSVDCMTERLAQQLVSFNQTFITEFRGYLFLNTGWSSCKTILFINQWNQFLSCSALLLRFSDKTSIVSLSRVK